MDRVICRRQKFFIIPAANVNGKWMDSLERIIEIKKK